MVAACIIADDQMSNGLLDDFNDAVVGAQEGRNGDEVATNQDPAALKRKLLRELRRLRAEAGLTQRDVAVALDWSPSKVIRVEAGNVAVSTTDLRALLQEYRVQDPEVVGELTMMARESKKQSSWQEYRDVFSREAATFFAYEASAAILRQFEPLLCPGILQTEEYTRALLKDAFQFEPRRIARYVESRAQRQEMLDRDEVPELFFILDEAVIRRRVGGEGVMKRQLQRLEELNARPEISIQVMEFSSGAYPGLVGPFTLLEFPDADDDNVLYLESRSETVTRDEPETTGEYLDLFYDLEERASSRDKLSEVLWQ